jgi:PAS domain S-box-containing protein
MLGWAWIRFTEPLPQVRSPEERRHARFLAALLVVLMPLGAVSAIVQLLLVPGFAPTFVAIGSAMGVLGIAYALSRTARYRLGAMLAVGTISLACFASIATNPRDVMAPAFLLLGVLIATNLLGMQATVIVAGLDTGALLMLHAIHPERDSSPILAAAMFLVIASGLVIVGAWHRDRLEGDRDAALRASEARWRLLLTAAFEGIVLTREGRVMQINEAGAAMLGSVPSELEGSELVGLFAIDSRPAVERALKTDPAGPIEASLRRAADGRDVPVEVAVVASTGRTEHALALRNLSTKRRFEAQLRLADRLSSLGTLTAAVAHELNNPLSYVLGNLDFIMRHAQGDVFAQYAGQAREGAERMRSILGGLRAFSRGDEEPIGPVDVAAVIASALTMAEAHLRGRCRVVCDLQTVRPALANGPRLGQVVMNLLLNAAQAIPEGRSGEHEIRINLFQVDERVDLAVSDTGNGIAADVLPHIFDPFFTTKLVGVGTGLGLWICHSIVRSFNGEIFVESTQERGTTFRVRLPCAPRESLKRSDAKPSTNAGGYAPE